MYAQQINNQWTELRGNIVFSPTVYQTAESLTGDQRIQFGVYLIDERTPPAVNRFQKLGSPIWTIKGSMVERSYPVVSKTPEEIEADLLSLKASITAATQQRLDDFARTRLYDDILSACTYANSAVPKFRNEGQYCVNARDATWAKLYQIMYGALAGTRPIPAGYADIEADLPPLEWPA